MPTEAPAISAASSAEATETQEKYRAYYQSLLDELRSTHKFTNARAAQPQNWYTFASDNSKIYKYSTAFAQGGRVRVEVYIDSGNKSKNEAIFDALFLQKETINESYGTSLEWEKLETKRACRIAIYRDGDIDADSEALVEIKKWVITNLLKMRQTLPKFLEEAISAVKSVPSVQT